MESRAKLFPDMVFEVLSKTCLQVLDSSRLVCKEWNKLTYDPSFMRSHSLNTNTLSGFVVQSLVHSKYESKFVSVNSQEICNHLSFEFLPVAQGGLKVEASSDQGLFVCVAFRRTGYGRARYYICKPCTKEYVTLPNPKTRYLTEGTALVVLASNPLHFKIIRLSSPKVQGLLGYTEYRCEIFDSASWKWKELNEIFFPGHEFVNARNSDCAVCARGLVYFLTSQDRVLAFDINSETYNIFPIPKPVYLNEDYERKQLVKYEGKLGFTCMTPDECLELWILNTDGMNQGSWKKQIVLTTKVLKEKEKYPTLKGFCSSGVALVGGYMRLIFYDIKSFDLNMERWWRFDSHTQAFGFRSDFEPCFRKPRMLK